MESSVFDVGEESTPGIEIREDSPVNDESCHFPQTLEETSADDFIRTYELENDQGSLLLIQKQVGGVHCVVWDASLVLAKYLEKLSLINEKFLQGKRVVELGSGLGCVGMVAAFYGAKVTLTDLPEALPLLEMNLRKNNDLIKKGKGNAKVKTLDWNKQIKKMETHDMILAADCIYYKESVLGFVETLKCLSNCSTKIFLSQENRSYSKSQSEIWQLFVDEVSKYFKLKIIPPREQHEDYRTPDIYLLELTKLSLSKG